jgi:hypothetical protein
MNLFDLRDPILTRDAGMNAWNNRAVDKHGFPRTVETKRLVLRCYRREDAAGILELVQQNRAQLSRQFAQLA